ncbi:MAG: DNA-binding response regulator, partial [Piscirickettsiaceae bacterium CG_4_10_14_0_2_um_filter_44_336]
LKLTASGEPALSPTIARKIIKHFERSHLSQPSHNLTNREQEVLIFIAKGLTSKEVASLLEISNYTVKEYIKNIYRKLNISSRSEATLEAIRFGLIHQF